MITAVEKLALDPHRSEQIGEVDESVGRGERGEGRGRNWFYSRTHICPPTALERRNAVEQIYIYNIIYV